MRDSFHLKGVYGHGKNMDVHCLLSIDYWAIFWLVLPNFVPFSGDIHGQLSVANLVEDFLGLEMAKGDDIQARLIAFGVRSLDLCDRIPKTPSGNHLASQLLRSASSAAPNYAEARGAESRKDFIHKLGIVFKELNESEVLLEILIQRGVLPLDDLPPIQEECRVLCRIIAASRKTAGRKPD